MSRIPPDDFIPLAILTANTLATDLVAYVASNRIMYGNGRARLENSISLFTNRYARVFATGLTALRHSLGGSLEI